MICFQDPNDARNHMSHLLSHLKETVSELTVDDLLPNSIFYPRQNVDSMLEKTERKSKNHRKNSSKIKIQITSQFRKNRLAVLIPIEYDSSCLDHGNSFEKNNNNDYIDSSEIEQENPMDHEDNCKLYSLHINFGNEELSSSVCVTLRIPSYLAPVIDWIRMCPMETSFGCEEILSSVARHREGIMKSKQSATSKEEISQLLEMLTFHGFIHLL